MRKKKLYKPDEKSPPAEQPPQPSEDEEEVLPPVRAESPEEEEPISLVDGDEEPGSKRGHIQAFGSAAGEPAIGEQTGFQRAPSPTGEGAIRCRLFHSKIAEGSLSYMQNQINQWLDQNEEIEVKHVGHMIGNLEGKTTEPNVIVMVWY